MRWQKTPTLTPKEKTPNRWSWTGFQKVSKHCLDGLIDTEKLKKVQSTLPRIKPMGGMMMDPKLMQEHMKMMQEHMGMMQNMMKMHPAAKPAMPN